MEKSDAQLESQEPDIFAMATVSSPDAIEKIPRNLRGLPAGVFRVYLKTKHFYLHIAIRHFYDYNRSLKSNPRRSSR